MIIKHRQESFHSTIVLLLKSQSLIVHYDRMEQIEWGNQKNNLFATSNNADEI